MFIFRAALCLLLMLLTMTSAVWAGVRLECPDKVSQGEPFYVRVVSDEPVEIVRLFWGPMTVDATVRSEAGAWVALAMLGTGSMAKPGIGQVKASIQGSDGPRELTRAVRITSRKFAEQRLKVAKKMVNLSQAQLDRHYREKARVKKAMADISPERFWNGQFLRPIPGGISSTYGLRRIFNGEPRKPHAGVDFRGKKGTPIKAVAPGEVVLTGSHYFSGNVVYVDHGLGVVSVYCHLSAIDVAEGQFVSAGQVLGKVGSTGRVTGPHLHFGLSVLGQYVDPMPLIEGRITP
ncbi:M23 family metallopeptidase [Desulfovibrio ferrophilus]|uniref:Peptidase M23 n=1 Tax=Desulfovibrio ferrophilus TaxID=241368 RepID=A0A2Z6AVK9_9BACT|nr:M23 family metallopeptidase [Desulfovibrio ferrophilus]BBD07274.1 peptidase M23 [Desulfovibrio ferrophilus]